MICLLTANSKAATALKIQLEMLPDGFEKKTQPEIADIIKKHAQQLFWNSWHRFTGFSKCLC